MIFLQADWPRPWNDYVAATDSSLEGFGVVSSVWHREEVAQVGRVMERSRFRKLGSHSARDSALTAAGFTRDAITNAWEVGDIDSETFIEQSGWALNKGFKEVPGHLLHADNWQPCLWGKWERKADILELEARALVKGLRRIALSVFGHDVRQLMLTDKWQCVYLLTDLVHAIFGCYSKSGDSLHTVARNVACAVRWIPSELNSADNQALPPIRAATRQVHRRRSSRCAWRTSAPHGRTSALGCALGQLTSSHGAKSWSLRFRTSIPVLRPAGPHVRRLRAAALRPLEGTPFASKSKSHCAAWGRITSDSPTGCASVPDSTLCRSWLSAARAGMRAVPICSAPEVRGQGGDTKHLTVHASPLPGSAPASGLGQALTSDVEANVPVQPVFRDLANTTARCQVRDWGTPLSGPHARSLHLRRRLVSRVCIPTECSCTDRGIGPLKNIEADRPAFGHHLLPSGCLTDSGWAQGAADKAECLP